jgi:hypothetical protein
LGLAGVYLYFNLSGSLVFNWPSPLHDALFVYGGALSSIELAKVKLGLTKRPSSVTRGWQFTVSSPQAELSSSFFIPLRRQQDSPSTGDVVFLSLDIVNHTRYVASIVILY